MARYTRGIIFVFLVMSIISTAFAINAMSNGNNTVPRITNININNITYSSADILFRVNQSDARTVVKYGTDTSLDNSSDWNNDTALQRKITLHDLLSGEKYYYSIYAYNNTDESLHTNIKTRNFTTTSTGNPSAPNITDISVDNITYSSADILFYVDQNDANTRVMYGIGNVGISIGSDWNNETALQRKITLHDLSSGTKYYYYIHAQNNTDKSLHTNTITRNFTTRTTSSGPKITNTSPEKTIHKTEKESVNFTVSFDRVVNVTWLLNGRQIKTNNSVRSSYYFNDTPSIGTWNVTVTGRNRNGTVSYSWKWVVHSENYKVGNRIWDSTKDMSTTYTWNSYSFSGFYYDIDNNVLTEELTIKDIDRGINKGDIIYKTSPIDVEFDHSDFGEYQVIGFMADKYFAGYTLNSTISDNRAISSLDRGQLHKVLIDDDNKRTVSVGGTLTLNEGYVLRMKEIDVGAGNRQIWITLLKNGAEIDDTVISEKEDYIYSKKTGSVENLPIIAIHFDTVFRGREVNAAFVKGIFQISDSYTDIKNGNRYDKMEISDVNKDKITMENRESISLSEGDTIDLMGNLRIIVADNSDLRFALSVERTGTFEARGTIYPLVSQWTPFNFGLDVGSRNVGFYYDIDEDIGTEKLEITGISNSGRSIPEGKLIYSTSPQDVSFSYSDFGKYQVIGFMADKYFAGYSSNNVVSNNKYINTIGNGQLHKVVIDDDSKRTVTEGGTLTLGEGYVLKLADVSVGAGKGQIWITLLKDGGTVDDGVLSGGDTYIYSKKVGSTQDLPIIAVHFDSVFRGTETNAAFVKGIFQISDSYTEVKSGNTYGKMEISEVNKDKITMENKGTISLSEGNTIDIMNNIKFKVADSSQLRFYPFVLVTQDMVENQLVIGAPISANAGDTISIKVTAGSDVVEGVSIAIEPVIGMINGNTNSNGILNFTLPITSKGTYTIVATKDNYQKATKTIDILQYVDNHRLSINIPLIINQFDTVSIQVLYNGTAISGAMILYDNTTIGSTNDSGILNYKFESSGVHTISASKTGYITISRDIDVKAPFSDFKAMDINILPDKVSIGQDILIRSNITNIGTKIDTKSVELIINGTVVDNKSIILSPNGIKEINFTYKTSGPEGNYTVEILGQKGILEVKKGSTNIFLIMGIIIIIGGIIIYIITAKNKTTGTNILESIRQKLNKKGKKGENSK